MKAKLFFGILVTAAAGVVGVSLYQGARPVKSVGTGLEAEVHAQPSAVSVQPKYLPQIDTITDAGLHWEERIKAVRALPAHLGDASTDRLFAFLEEPPSFGEENWYLICNEIMEVMRKRCLAPETFTRKHLALIESSKADPMIRDYAAQHLAQWISGLEPGASESDRELASSAFDAMSAQILNPANGRTTLTGTALSALTDSVVTGDEIMKAKRGAMGEVALKILNTTDGSVSQVNRSTALQAAARLNAPGLPDRCRQLISDQQEAVDVRLSSIAALGQVGSRQDVPMLQSFTSDEALKFAARAALDRIASQP